MGITEGACYTVPASCALGQCLGAVCMWGAGGEGDGWAMLPASTLVAREAGQTSIWHSHKFSGRQTQEGVSNTRQLKRRISF